MVVYDRCGCGGGLGGCDLDWLSSEDIAVLTAVGPPVIHQRKHGRADLEHWQSVDNTLSLIVAAVDVFWGDRFG